MANNHFVSDNFAQQSYQSSTTASAASEASSTANTASKTSASTKTSASSSAAYASSTAGAAAAPPTDGLSVGAKAGVALGAGAVGVALLALALAMCRSRRLRKRALPQGSIQISEPLPGSGRIDYSVPNQHPTQPEMTAGSKLSTAFNMAELDQARPYEEMVPRVTPRRMV